MNLAWREGLVIGAGTLLLAVERNHLPRSTALGDLLLAPAALLLLQGLVRDVARAATSRRAGAARHVTCVCLESTLGIASIVAGAVLALAWTSLRVQLPPAAWPIGFAAVALFGLATRDVVLDWRARRLRRESDHSAIVRLR